MDEQDNLNAQNNDPKIPSAMLSSHAKRAISSLVSATCTDQNDETSPSTESDDGPPSKLPKTAFRPVLMDVSVSYNRDESTYMAKVVETLGEPSEPTPKGHIVAAKATITFSKEVRSAEERWPALKTAPRYSPDLYNAQLRYSTEDRLYSVRITRSNASAVANRGDDDAAAENAHAVAEIPQEAPPVEFDTNGAEKAVNFLLDNLEHPRLFNLHIVRGADVVAALKKREDKKLIIEHALGIEYYEGVAPASPQEVIERMGEVESVLLRNMPGAQAKYIKNYLDNSLLELCLQTFRAYGCRRFPARRLPRTP